jgi:hypothetical protein
MIYLHEDVLTEDICSDIIELFDDNEKNTRKKSYYTIPKNDKEWVSIEYFLYKQLLIHINKYKDELIQQGYFDTLKKIEKKLFLHHFKIAKINIDSFEIERINDEAYKLRSPFRNKSFYNLFTFIFILTSDNDCILNVVNKESSKQVKFKEGCLILFPDDIDFMYNVVFENKCVNYIITGQLIEKIPNK